MDRTKVGTLITISIEQYVSALDSSDVELMRDEYEAAARSMFDWLRAYRCDAKAIGKACSIIQSLTGKHPSQVRTSNDAEALKQALYGAKNSQQLGERVSVDDLIDPVSWAVENVRFGHGGDVDPFDRQS
jgi:hypothetical protein